MARRDSKNIVRVRIHERIRHRVKGTPERPRLAVYRSLSHIYAQILDDSKGVTIASASSNYKSATTKGGSTPSTGPARISIRSLR